MALLTPIKAIRAKCLDCSCGSRKEVSNCQIPDCPIYPYRFGKRPETINKNIIKIGGKDYETTA